MGGSGTTTRAGPFDACVWGDFFVTYVPPPSQRSEEWMIERVEQLKGQVRRMFEAAMAKGTAATATLVDTLERLGIDNHFRDEMGLALSHIHGDDELLEFGTDLHTVALCFRLLRQHGFWVSADVFEQFKDGTGSFSQGLSNHVRGLLSLYNAAHMASPGEEGLDGAIAFARSHLLEAAAEGKLMSPMAEQVSRALGIPLPRFLLRLEAMHYVAEYEQEEEHDAVILELARLDYTFVKSLHLKELKELTLWWRDLYDNVKLTYSRDRIVEMYFWALGVYHTEEYSRGRIMLTKVIALTTLMDDTYDVYATFEDSQKFNEAIQRWDESAVSILPEYLRMLYMKTLSNFKEFEDILEPDEKYRVSYVQKAYKSLSKYYLQEAKWSNENYMPSFKEHMDLTAVSTALPMLSLAALMGAGQVHATKKTLEWGLREPDMIRACGEIGRLLNDIASYKKGKNKKDVASSMECYLKEHGSTGEEAAAAFAAMTEHAWRRINWLCMEIDPTLLPAAQQVVVNLARTCEIIYYGGRDAYTFGVDLRDLVTSLFLTPGPA